MAGRNNSALSLTQSPNVASSGAMQRQAKEKPYIALSNKSMAKRLHHKLVIDGVDVSPQTLTSGFYQSYRLISFLDRASDSHSDLEENAGSFAIPRGSTIFLTTKNQSHTNVMTHTISRANSLVDDQDSQVIEKYITSRHGTGPSAFYIPKVPSQIIRSPHVQIKITLRETGTLIIFDIASTSVDQETDEADQVEDDNEYYEYITVGKGKNRKTAHAEVQTLTQYKKCATTCIGKHDRMNGTCHTNNWIMYDERLADEQENVKRRVKNESVGEDKNSLGVKTGDDSEANTDDIMSLLASSANANDQKNTVSELRVIASSQEFRHNVSKMERVLASNVFNSEQLRFKGLFKQSPLRLDVDFKYTLTHMWTFTCDDVEGRCVTAMCWNRVNKNLLAVGYGRYKYNEKKSGLVCCWSVKNPVQPERKFKFDVPVTSIDFSEDHPNLLAVGFTNGTVYLIDVSALDSSVIAASKRVTSPSYEAVWQVRWIRDDVSNEEQIMTAAQDGRISKYRMNKEFTCSLLMRINRMEGTVKGVEQPRKCQAHELPVSQHPAVLLIVPLPTDRTIYYAGTDEGSVHKCSVNNVDQHLDLFVAHNGPIYCFQYSPFCHHIFMTGGADWSVRIWAEGIFEPLLAFTASMEALQGATWCPINSTILASITGSDIELWDIRRKTFVPASVTSSPTGGQYTVVQYTESGDNLLAGDVDGCVHVYACSDMPFSPFYQEEALVEAIMKNLITKQSLAKQLKKIGKPFSSFKY